MFGIFILCKQKGYIGFVVLNLEAGGFHISKPEQDEPISSIVLKLLKLNFMEAKNKTYLQLEYCTVGYTRLQTFLLVLVHFLSTAYRFVDICLLLAFAGQSIINGPIFNCHNLRLNGLAIQHGLQQASPTPMVTIILIQSNAKKPMFGQPCPQAFTLFGL